MPVKNKINSLVQDIQQKVGEFYGLKLEDFKARKRTKAIAFPRQIAMYLCRRELKTAFQGIGQIFGRDHSTVMTSIKQIEKKIAEQDKELHGILAEIEQVLMT